MAGVCWAWLGSAVLFGLLHLPTYRWDFVQCLLIIGTARLVLSMAYIKTIDELGGVQKAIEKNYMQKEIQDSAYAYQKEIEAEDRIVVGVNKFQMEEDIASDLLYVDPQVEDNQKMKLGKLKATRDNKRTKAALETLRTAARTDENLMPRIITAVEEYATIGEICGVLREEFGEYKQTY